jgi:hypothetical protein
MRHSGSYTRVILFVAGWVILVSVMTPVIQWLLFLGLTNPILLLFAMMVALLVIAQRMVIVVLVLTLEK